MYPDFQRIQLYLVRYKLIQLFFFFNSLNTSSFSFSFINVFTSFCFFTFSSTSCLYSFDSSHAACDWAFDNSDCAFLYTIKICFFSFDNSFLLCNSANSLIVASSIGLASNPLMICSSLYASSFSCWVINARWIRRLFDSFATFGRAAISSFFLTFFPSVS